jgi:outer membrane protein OmpA-like peptidoglycan-associated protein
MKFAVLAMFLFVSMCLTAQDYSTKSKKAISYYEEAMRKMQMRDYADVVEILQLAIKTDDKFLEAYLLMADAYDYMGNQEKVVECCRNAMNVGADKYPVAYFFLTEALYKTGKYDEALIYAQKFKDIKQVTPSQEKETDKIISNCKFAIQAIAHPVPFKPENIGNNVNSNYDEYWPSLSADEEMLVFTRLLPINENNLNPFHNRQEDLYFSLLKDSVWQLAKPVGYPVNTMDNEGAESITSDGFKMYFTACNRPDGLGKCDIYVTVKTDIGWSEPKNLGEPINSGYSEKQPSISSDGKDLYFTSNRPGGKGGYDIWVSSFDNDNKWGVPVNLGDSINTPDDDQSPYIHPDNQTLYFASDGWPGMGGQDLFYSRKKADGKWSTPVNLGYPINTFADEIGLVVNSKGNHAYFSSNRIPEKGRDIFDFDLYKEARPLLVSYMKGKVYDAETKVPLEANFELIDFKSAAIINQATSNRFNGEFLVCIPTDKNYALNVSRKGYLFYSENFNLSGIHDKSKPFYMDIAMQPIKNGNKVILKNIFFDTNSTELQDESTAELTKLIQFMNENPTIKIEVSGYTDNIGSDSFNQQLSENRAKTVANYLVNKGIAQSRIVYKGFGKTQPIADNNSEEGRAVNRRTEFKIIGY